MDENYQDYILDILFSISNQVPIALEQYLCLFEKFTCYDSFKIDKIISTVGKSLKVNISNISKKFRFVTKVKSN